MNDAAPQATLHAPTTKASATLTAYVIAYNEADKIQAAVESVLWADEVIVADSHSTDGTAEIAESLGARVIQIDFEGFGKLRNSVLEHCSKEWVFSLDSDERCTAEARDEILRVIADPESADIYKVPRRNWFMGRWIKHSGWYPNFRQPQLFRRGALQYDELPVHEGWIARDGARVAILDAEIWQFPFRNLSEIQHKANRYSTLGAEALEGKGVRSSMFGALVHGLHSFFKHYILKLGFLDGWAGFIIAAGTLEGAFFKHAKRVENRHAKNWAPPPAQRLQRKKESD